MSSGKASFSHRLEPICADFCFVWIESLGDGRWGVREIRGVLACKRGALSPASCGGRPTPSSAPLLPMNNPCSGHRVAAPGDSAGENRAVVIRGEPGLAASRGTPSQAWREFRARSYRTVFSGLEGPEYSRGSLRMPPLGNAGSFQCIPDNPSNLPSRAFRVFRVFRGSHPQLDPDRAGPWIGIHEPHEPHEKLRRLPRCLQD